MHRSLAALALVLPVKLFGKLVERLVARFLPVLQAALLAVWLAHAWLRQHALLLLRPKCSQSSRRLVVVACR